MIGRLTGRLLEKKAPALLLDVNGVGYELDAPMNTFYQLPDVGQNVTLYTHLSIREDAHSLFGFSNESDRNLFRQLIKINGVGAKLALAILSTMPGEQLAMVVHNEDSASLKRVPGVGNKMAERLLIELRDRLKNWRASDINATVPANENKEDFYPGNALGDALSALTALGFKPAEATRMVGKIDTQTLSSEEIIRLALQTVST